MATLCERVFGKGFVKSINRVHCALGFFVMNKHLSPVGMLLIDDKKVLKIPKAYFWSYLYYIIYHNRSLTPFKEFEKHKHITETNLVQAVEPKYPKKKNITRKHLFAYINKLALDYKLNLPIMKDVGAQTTATAAFIKTMPRGTQDITITTSNAEFDSTLNNLTIPLDIQVTPAKLA